MILIALGGNLNSAEFGPPRAVLGQAMALLAAAGVRIVDQAPWYHSAPVPVSDQPWFVNSVAHIVTALAPAALLALLHRVEAGLGRQRPEGRRPAGGRAETSRSERWAARIIDLDLLSYGDRVIGDRTEDGLVLPHPRLADRAFVLTPLADLVVDRVPAWRHPVSRRSAPEMLAELGVGQQIQRMDD